MLQTTGASAPFDANTQTETNSQTSQKPFPEKIKFLDALLHIQDNFDIIKREYTVGTHSIVIYYVAGLIVDQTLERIAGALLEMPATDEDFSDANRFSQKMITYGEVNITSDESKMLELLYTGCVVLVCDAFEPFVILTVRGYPQRNPEEPENDKVLRGPHISFVETLAKNTALLRRHIHDPRFIIKPFTVGNITQTKVTLCYMHGIADPELVKTLSEKIDSIQTHAIGMGVQSLSESLVRQRWYNPLPKFRYTERPDAACASIAEGSIVLLCDNSPEAMIFPVGIFDFLQQSDDFYLPPLTSSYLRIVRLLTCLASILLTPLWYLALTHPAQVPTWLSFIITEDNGPVPILAQLFLLEICIDGLKLASLNTPDMLSNSLSVVGGLILGEYAVSVGWFSSQCILYVAFTAIANFTQHNYELAYSFKYMRLLLLILCALFGGYGFLVGLGVIILALATNQTVEGRKRYFYPLIPFNGRALLRLFVRLPKSTTERTEQKGSGKEVQESANRKKESKNGMKRS